MPDPPPGQHFLLRRHLQGVFDRAGFKGEAWQSCVRAFLTVPGIPVLMHNGTTQGPASFFRKVFEPRPGDTPASGHWTALLDQLQSLGERRVAQLVITDDASSWVIFLSDDFTDVLAFGGLPLPQPRYSFEQDDADIKSAEVVRTVLDAKPSMRITKLDHSNLDAKVELVDAFGNRLLVTFSRALRVQIPEAANEEVATLVELGGATGRKWFVFEPVGQRAGRKLTVQASAVSWRVLAP